MAIRLVSDSDAFGDSRCGTGPDDVAVQFGELERSIGAERPQLILRIPCQYVEQEFEPHTFRRVDYLTGEPSSDRSSESPNLVTFRISVRPYDPSSPLYRVWQRFPDIGQMRYGLSYQPLVVQSRPETHWDAGYFKPDVSGDDFHIRCRPETPGFSTAPQKWCMMALSVNPTEFDGRMWAVRVETTFRVERLTDWQAIERRTLELYGSARPG